MTIDWSKPTVNRPKDPPPAPPPMRRGDGGLEDLQWHASEVKKHYKSTVKELDSVCAKQTALVWLGLFVFLLIEIPVLHYYFLGGVTNGFPQFACRTTI